MSTKDQTLSAALHGEALLTANHPDLQPLIEHLGVVAQGRDDIRTERRRHAERHARTLPVRLAFPLVLCTLPSFVLVAIVPALLGAVSTLRGSAP